MAVEAAALALAAERRELTASEKAERQADRATLEAAIAKEKADIAAGASPAQIAKDYVAVEAAALALAAERRELTVTEKAERQANRAALESAIAKEKFDIAAGASPAQIAKDQAAVEAAARSPAAERAVQMAAATMGVGLSSDQKAALASDQSTLAIAIATEKADLAKGASQARLSTDRAAVEAAAAALETTRSTLNARSDVVAARSALVAALAACNVNPATRTPAKTISADEAAILRANPALCPDRIDIGARTRN